MFGILVFSNNLFSTLEGEETIFTGLIWVDKCPAETEWNDLSANEVQSEPCGG